MTGDQEDGFLFLAFNDKGELDTLENVQAEHEAKAVDVLARHLWRRTSSPVPDPEEWEKEDAVPGGHEICERYRDEARRVIGEMRNA
jgi:hypothetical protein